MSESSTSTRRDFLLISGRTAGAAWLAANASLLRATAARAAEARRAGAPFQVLTDAEAREIEAMAARILPSGETPGAREAGVIHFIDRALEDLMSGAAPVVRGAAEALNAAAGEAGADRFSELEPEAQDRIVAGLEEGEGEGGSPPFFSVVRFLTVAGMFANPEYGGNREKAGWELLGFDDQPVWRPPFGWYDREAHGEDPGGSGPPGGRAPAGEAGSGDPRGGEDAGDGPGGPVPRGRPGEGR